MQLCTTEERKGVGPWCYRKTDPSLSLCEIFKAVSLLTENAHLSPTALCDATQNKEVLVRASLRGHTLRLCRVSHSLLGLLTAQTTSGNAHRGSQPPTLGMGVGTNPRLAHRDCNCCRRVWPRAVRKGNRANKPDPGQQEGLRLSFAASTCGASPG